MREQLLFDYILRATWRERCGAVLLISRQLLPEPGHRPIQVMQVEIFTAGDAILPAPALGRQIRPTAHQPMQHGEEYRPFDRKAVTAPTCQGTDHAVAA